jgi:thymidylate synthase (FAD)
MDYKNTVFDILDHGEVELIDKIGDDLSIVNAAKVSFSASLSEMNEHGIGLINYLMKNKHATPFEHVVFKFRIKAPIFVTREWMRHRWSSFNEMSMRYYIPPVINFYTPESKNIRRQIGKPGAYKFEPVNDENLEKIVQERLDLVYKLANSVYNDLIELGIAKEIARFALPVSQYTEFIWTVNARSLINFLSLRNEESAQYEIQEYAKCLENIFAELLPITHQAFIDSGRIAI